MLRDAVQSFEPTDHDALDDHGKPTGERACSNRARGEHEAIAANAEVGHYAGRADELATDLRAVGAPAELMAYAEQGGFDDEQAHRAEEARAPKAVPLPGETSDVAGDATLQPPQNAPESASAAPAGV